MGDGGGLIAVVTDDTEVVNPTMDRENVSRDATIEERDTEKRVLDTDGNRLGRITDVQNGVARVEPTSEATVGALMRAVRASRERRAVFSEEVVEDVTDHDVVLTD